MAYHLLPIDDLEEHEESSTCKCKPELRMIDGEMVLIHNSFDGREIVEQLIDELHIENEN